MLIIQTPGAGVEKMSALHKEQAQPQMQPRLVRCQEQLLAESFRLPCTVGARDWKLGILGSQILDKDVDSAGATHSEHTGTGNNYPSNILRYPLLSKLTANWEKKRDKSVLMISSIFPEQENG